MGVKQAIKSLDAFPRAEEHLLQKTQSGAFVSVIGLVIMATLFYHELAYYLTTYTVHQHCDRPSKGMDYDAIIPLSTTHPFLSYPDNMHSGHLGFNACNYRIETFALFNLGQFNSENVWQTLA